MASQPVKDEALFYLMALTMIPSIGDVLARGLLQNLGHASAIFQCKLSQLEKIPGIGKVRARRIKAFNDFSRIEEEMKFLEKYHVRAISIIDEHYPKKLSHCYDAPILIYFRGNANLNATKSVSIIGTRSNTDYGKEMVRAVIESFAPLQVLVVSGLAHGIDAIAHKTALKNGMDTIGVLAHGLDTMYPATHRALAREMIEQGGLVTEYPTGNQPDKQNFPRRNRIVAGMTDATLVIETAKEGGSMITAELANGYNRDVFAFPGRARDPKSEGCNYLIKTNKAALVTCGKDMIEMLNWDDKKISPKKQSSIFAELNEEEKFILQILQKRELTHIDQIYAESNMKSSAVAAALLSLEMQNLVISLPGKMYKAS